MSKVNLRAVYEFILDFWSCIKATIDFTDSDEYWNNLAQLENELYEKHNRHPLAYKLIWAYNDYLEDERKRMQNAKIQSLNRDHPDHRQ